MNIISIISGKGSPTEKQWNIETTGFLILYIEGDKIKTSGDIELKALAPLLMKLAADRWEKSSA